MLAPIEYLYLNFEFEMENTNTPKYIPCLIGELQSVHCILQKIYLVLSRIKLDMPPWWLLLRLLNSYPPILQSSQSLQVIKKIGRFHPWNIQMTCSDFTRMRGYHDNSPRNGHRDQGTKPIDVDSYILFHRSYLFYLFHVHNTCQQNDSEVTVGKASAVFQIACCASEAANKTAMLSRRQYNLHLHCCD